MSRPAVAYLHPHLSTFIQTDQALLAKFADVRPLEYRGIGDVASLVKALALARASVSWFALGHAYLATKLGGLMGRGSVVVAGGWDVCQVPDLAYGYTLVPRRRAQVQETLSRATQVLAVSPVVEAAIEGLAADAQVTVLPLGFDDAFFRPGTGARREGSVLTVASLDAGTLRLKGLDTLAAVAASDEDLDVTIVGRVRDAEGRAYVEALPENVRVLSDLSPEELLHQYQEAAVYVQLSAHESFGAALAEALLCECNAVVTDRGALPDVAGEAAAYVPYGDAAATREAVREAMDRGPNREGRERIADRFSLAKREAGLRDAVHAALGEVP